MHFYNLMKIPKFHPEMVPNIRFVLELNNHTTMKQLKISRKNYMEKKAGKCSSYLCKVFHLQYPFHSNNIYEFLINIFSKPHFPHWMKSLEKKWNFQIQTNESYSRRTIPKSGTGKWSIWHCNQNSFNYWSQMFNSCLIYI